MKKSDEDRLWAIYEWIMDNEEEGKKEYPEQHKHLTEIIDRISPYQEIQIIKTVISHFPNWINTINKLLPKARKKRIADIEEKRRVLKEKKDAIKKQKEKGNNDQNNN